MLSPLSFVVGVAFYMDMIRISSFANKRILSWDPPYFYPAYLESFIYQCISFTCISVNLYSFIECVSFQVEEGWWEGVLNGKTGMFPSNFTREIAAESDMPLADTPTSHDELRSQTSETTSSKMSFYSLFD